jgi:membrane protease YdiL (CAAX protease family)
MNTSATADPIATREHRKPFTGRPWTDFTVFATVTAGFCWLYVAMDRATGAAIGTGNATSAGGTAGQGLWILVPALTGLALGMLRRDRRGRFGFTLRFANRGRWFALALAFPLAATATMVLTGTLTGAATFQWMPGPGKPALVDGILAVLPFLIVKNVVEEFIFRGYGTPAAMALGLRRPWSHLLVGAVWALWHLPLYLVWMSQSDYLATTSLSKAVYLPMLCLGALAMAVVLGEMRVQTGSIWPGVVLHTVAGALAAALLIDGHLERTQYGDALFSPNANSIASTLLFAAAGFVLLRRGTQAPGR